MARSWGITCLPLLLIGCSGGCGSETEPGAATRPSAGSASASVEHATSGARPLVPRGSASVARRENLAPLAGPKDVSLSVGSKAVGRASVPVGQTLTQPVLVVLTTPETADQCDVWQRIKPVTGFLLCPTPSKDAASGVQHLKSAIKALEAKFGKHVGPRSTLVGYGVGADAALDLMRESPILFPRGFLIGGGVSGFGSGVVQAFAAQGGERVLFACEDCAAGRSVSNLLRSGVAARHVAEAKLDAEALGSAWAWLSEGDAWWKPDASN